MEMLRQQVGNRRKQVARLLRPRREDEQRRERHSCVDESYRARFGKAGLRVPCGVGPEEVVEIADPVDLEIHLLPEKCLYGCFVVKADWRHTLHPSGRPNAGDKLRSSEVDHASSASPHCWASSPARQNVNTISACAPRLRGKTRTDTAETGSRSQRSVLNRLPTIPPAATMPPMNSGSPTPDSSSVPNAA